jgi:cytochrome c556
MSRVVMRTTRLLLAGSVAVLTACGGPPVAEAPGTTPATPALWGDMKPVVSVKELMRDMLDPISDNIFNAVGTIVTDKGAVDTVPKTDEDWDKIRIGAVTLAEGAYLLKVPRPFAPPGDLNNSTGPNPVELSPDQITEKVRKDPVEWNARIEALRNVALEVMDIVKKKDVDQLWNAGEDLDIACENCHRSYWYPGEDAAFYKRLRDRMEQFREQEQSRGKSK